MNAYMTMFAAMGFIYLILLSWAMVSWFPISIMISVLGMIICTMGHRYSRDNL